MAQKLEILSLGEKIKKKRKEKNMTLKELAGTKVTQGQISLIESGKSNPSMDLLKYLAQMLDVSLDYLMESDVRQLEQYFNYYADMFFISISLGRMEEAEKYLNLAEGLYEEYEIERHGDYLLYIRGFYNHALGHWDTALGYLYQATIKENIFTYDEYMDLTLKAAEITYSQGAYNASLKYLTSLERYTEKSSLNLKYLKNVYFFLIRVHRKLKNYEEMERYLKLTINALKSLNRTMENVETMYEIARDNEDTAILRSMEMASQGRNLQNVHRFHEDQMRILKEVAGILSKEGNHAQSMEIITKELGFASVYGDGSNTVPIFLRLARGFIGIKQYNVAMYMIGYINSTYQIEDYEILSFYHQILGEYYEGMKDEARALDEYHKALKISTEYRITERAAESALKLSEIYLNLSRNEEARRYLEEYMRIRDLLPE